MDGADRRKTLWCLASLLALPLLLGPGGLARALLSGPARPGDLPEPRPRITPPDHSVKRHV
jgi:hypothetical protein